jgi:Tfp pilus assembly protein PilE
MIRDALPSDVRCCLSAEYSTANRVGLRGFTFAEVCVAMVVCVIFGAAAFATNQRLLIALKSQKETTAATMMLQERMEKIRSFSYSDLANRGYVKTNIVQVPTTSEAALSNLSETITVGGQTLASVPNPLPSPSPFDNRNQWVRNSANPTGQELSQDDNLATQFDLLRVDIQLTWTSANGRTRSRELAAFFGKGNIGQ